MAAGPDPQPKPADPGQELRLLLADGRIREALDRLLVLTQKHSGLHGEVILQSQKFSEFEKDERSGTVDYEDLNRTQAQITEALIVLVDQLPESDPASSGGDKPTGIPEGKLKLHLFLLVFGSKLAIAIWLWVQWDTGGFLTDEFISTLSLLIPVFATYSGLILRDMLKQQMKDTLGSTDKYMPRSLLWIGYLVTLTNLILICFITGLYPQGKVNYQQMTSLLSLAEAGLGFYVGMVVFAIFKKEE